MKLVDSLIDSLRSTAPPKDHPNAELLDFMFDELADALTELEWTPASLKRFMAKMDSVEEVSGGLFDVGLICWVVLTLMETEEQPSQDVIRNLVAELQTERS